MTDSVPFVETYWYRKALIFGIYGIFIIFDSLKEQIDFIETKDNKIRIQSRKFFKKSVAEFNREDIQNCTLYIYRGCIKLEIILNNGENINVSHRSVTPMVIEKISQISDFTDKFNYVISHADFPGNADVFERIIKKDKKAISEQRIFSYIIVTALVLVTVIIAMCSFAG